LHVDERIQV